MSGLILNGRNFSRDWIVGHFQNLDAETFSEYDKMILTFCGEWLSGVKQFKVYTSGSTGEPKPISLTREQMILSARMTGEALNLKSGDRTLVCLSPQYIAGLMMLVRGLVLELELTIVEPSSDPFESFDLKKVPPFDFTALVPLQMQAILSNPEHTVFLSKMKAVLVGGAAMAISLQKQIQKMKAPVYQTFGMTETVSHFALRRLSGPNASESYQVLRGVEIGQDERGCLTIQSALINHRTVVTNDMVELVSDKSFIWQGRVDNVINSGGVKVPAERVEAALGQALYEMDVELREFFVVGMADERYHEVVVVVFTGKPLPAATEKTLKELLAKRLKMYELPKRILYMDSVVRTRSGKIDRRASLVKFSGSSADLLKGDDALINSVAKHLIGEK